MVSKRPLGDIHAPVEDTEVPLGLKVLVVTLFLLVIAMALSLAMSLSAV